MIGFFQKKIRDRFVTDKSYNFKFDSVNGSYVLNGAAQASYTRKGGVLAQYAGRFILISFDDFVSIMTDGNKKESESLQTQLSALQDKSDIESYIKKYNNVVDDFYKQYEKRKSKNNNIFKTINEEISHHKLIKDTPLYVILNSLTIYYRICSCYLTHHRYHKKKVDIRVLESFINTYLIRSHIIEMTYPIVEASYHYHDDLSTIENQYGDAVKKWCEKFKSLEEKIRKIKDIDEKKIPNLMDMVQKTLLSYPYISAITQVSKLNLKKFIQCYDESYTKLNDDLFDVIDYTIDADGFKLSDLVILLRNKRILRTTNTQLDNSYIASLIFLGTEPSDDFMPKSLKRFVAKQLVICKNKKVFATILRNSKEVDEAYSKYPPVKCIGRENQSFCIDKAMQIFKGKTFIIAQNSFEPTFSGEDGMKSICESPHCCTLLIQTLLIKTLFLLLFKKIVFCNTFKREFKMLLSVMPKNYTNFLENTVLPLFFDETKNILNGFNTIEEVDMEIVAKRFEESVNYLHSQIQTWDEDNKNSFFTFCDINYVHGY